MITVNVKRKDKELNLHIQNSIGIEQTGIALLRKKFGNKLQTRRSFNPSKF